MSLEDEISADAATGEFKATSIAAAASLSGHHHYSIRKADTGDAIPIKALADSYKFTPEGNGVKGKLLPLSTARIHELISQGRFIVGELEGEIIGCCSVVDYGTEAGTSLRIAELRSLAVIQDYQGNRLGSKLIDTGVEEAKARGYQMLYTFTQNPELFERAGFERTEVPPEKLMQDCKQCFLYEMNICNETALVANLQK